MASFDAHTRFSTAIKDLREVVYKQSQGEFCARFKSLADPVSQSAWSDYERGKALPNPKRFAAVLDALKLVGEERAQLWRLFAIELVAEQVANANEVRDAVADTAAFFKGMATRLGVPEPQFGTPHLTVEELIKNHIKDPKVIEVWVAARKTMVERGVAIEEVLSVAVHKPYVYFLRSKAQARGIATKLWNRAKTSDYDDHQRAAILEHLSFRIAGHCVTGFAEVTSMQILSDGHCVRYVRDSATPHVKAPCYRRIDDPEAAARMYDDLLDCPQEEESIGSLLNLGVPNLTDSLTPFSEVPLVAPPIAALGEVVIGSASRGRRKA